MNRITLNIVSIEDDRLVALHPTRQIAANHQEDVWVAKSGIDPRAWFRPNQPDNNFPWMHGRFPADRLLVPTEIIRKRRMNLLAVYRRQLQWHRSPEALSVMHKVADHLRCRLALLNERRAMIATVTKDCRFTFVEAEGVNGLQNVLKNTLTPDFEAELCSKHDIEEWNLPVYGPMGCKMSSRPVAGKTIGPRKPLRYIISDKEMSCRKGLLEEYRKLLALESWLKRFPVDALDFVHRHNVHERRWHLINLWIRIPATRDLFDEIPALAVALSSAWCFRETKPSNLYRTIGRLAKRKRTSILAWLGFPPRSAVLTLLKRLTPSAMTVRNLLRLRELLAVREKSLNRLLDFCDSISPVAIRVLRAPALPTTSILRLVTGNGRDAALALNLFMDACDMTRLIGSEIRCEILQALERVDGLPGLRQVHEQIMAITWTKMHAVGQHEGAETKAEETGPPLQGTSAIVPLQTSQKMMDEARLMNNCLHSYIARFEQGSYYAYSVQWNGSRATLGLKSIDTLEDYGASASCTRWIIDQIEGPDNSPADPAAVRHVREWFEGHQQEVLKSRQMRAG